MKKHPYLRVFLISFFIFIFAIAPLLIPTKGVWVFYGDFNVQQLPFYIHVHDAIRSGNFLYDWSTDLGGSLIGCYSFYLLGSPFFWLTIPFDSSLIPYLMPFLSALKYAVMAVTAFAYARRHLDSYTGAFIAALLYAFSGFQGAVLVYNHFHDVMAFFPLYLLLFEKTMEEKKHLGFILMTAFMAILNYYFFFGEVVFIVIYFFAKYVAGNLNRNLMETECESTCAESTERSIDKSALTNIVKMSLSAFFDGLTGLLLAGAFLLPGIYYTSNNSRLTNTLLGYNLLTYQDSYLALGIIKNIIMLPDVSGLNSMFNPSMSRVSGIAGYIPLFSIAGVVAFFLYNKKEKMWEKRLIITCLIFAFVPFLNSLFSAINNEYYARWFFMPILIMSVMTADMVGNSEKRVESRPYILKGAVIVAIISAFISLCSLLPAEDSNDNLTILGNLKNPDQLVCEIIFSAIMLIVLFLYIMKLYKGTDSIIRILVVLACFATTLTMLATGMSLIDSDRKSSFISQALYGQSPFENLLEGISPAEAEDYLTDVIQLVEKESNSPNEFYRIETEEDVYNYPMLWNAHSITSFISTIPDGTISFYESVGIRRKVTSNLSTSRIGARALLSGKYFVKELGNAIERIGRVEDMTELKGYEGGIVNNDFELFENTNYIPMGFTFDSYLLEDEYKNADLSTSTKDRYLVKALILDEDTANKYEGLLEHLDSEKLNSIGYNEFVKDCKERRNSSCDTFTVSTNGFKATVNMEKDNLLFFSVPYEEGFTAYVDGKETDIEKVDFGFMAVFVPEGNHEITFEYLPSYLKTGLNVSALGLILLTALLMVYMVSQKETNINNEQNA